MQPRGASKKAFLIDIGTRAILATTAALVLLAHAFAQINTGSIMGTVRDPSGAVIVGAQVDITNTATNVMIVLTNADGNYQAFSPHSRRLQPEGDSSRICSRGAARASPSTSRPGRKKTSSSG